MSIAGSRNQVSPGANPHFASPVTGGPLGTNKDGGDPKTPRWFVGDTPGATGHKDHGDPDGQMCHQQLRFELYIKMAQEAKKKECAKVRAELTEAQKIRNAFLDHKLLEEARDKDWDGDEYHTKVGEKVFGKPKPSAPKATFVNPMYTDPYSCNIVENWDHDVYRSKEIPDIVYETDKAHERTHRGTCLAARGTYAADMSFPAKRSAEEVKAYTAKIDLLEKWFRENCQSL